MITKGIKTMILGIQIMLVGGFIILDPSSNLGGIEFFIIIVGLLTGVFGFLQND
ncbi:MAG: hypothetical protein C5S44_08975 [Candidatus Methanocomedens sp.]|jgi:hypothetical protein|nr:MAG: hypothetical protein C5S44_08975 [ANME-2 cluster archaeon]